MTGSLVNMTNLILATDHINENEKAWAYQEVNLQAPGSKGFRRYRIIIVNRDGNLAEYREDMGLATKWKGTRQLNIPALWEHTVAELMDIADNLRWKDTIDVKDLLQLDNMKLV